MPESPYSPIFESIFLSRYSHRTTEIAFDDADIIATARRLNIRIPKDPGEIVRRTRFGLALPLAITNTASRGRRWRIRTAKPGMYRFKLEPPRCFTPRPD